MLLAVGHPLVELWPADGCFGLHDGAPANARQHQLVPEFISGRQTFGACASLIAPTMAQASDGSKL